MRDQGVIRLTGAAEDTSGATRRAFLQRGIQLGAFVLTPTLFGGLLSACADATGPARQTTIDLTNEVGVLNFCYAVLQLEADFYARVTSNKFPGMLAAEASQFGAFQSDVGAATDDLRMNEIPRHRITDLALFRLGSIVNFSNRTSVFSHAQMIEDNAASGFLAARALVQTPAVSQIVQSLSDAATSRADGIRSMNGSPSSTITPESPADVMAALAPYYLTTFTVRGT